ncbi:MAG: hypothetical protein AMXMBFR33_66600 [Candidatus Xenobia bacterium]
MRKAILISGLTLLFWLWQAAECTGQPPRLYEPFQMTAEFRQAEELVTRKKKFSEGVEALLALAEAHPDTTLGAVSMSSAAYWCAQFDRPRAESIYRSLIAAYPNSRFEICAKLNLLNMRFRRQNMEGYLVECDRLLSSYAAPTIMQVLGGDRSRLAREARLLPLELQYGLDEVYAEARAALSCQLERYADGLKVDLFRRQAFVDVDGNENNIAANLRYDLSFLHYGTWRTGMGTLFANPTVKLRSPRDGKVTGPRPRIRFETSVGDIRFIQVDLSRIQLTLDGQDMTPYLSVRTKVPHRLRDGHPTEKLRFEARPPMRLSPGLHQAHLVVQVSGYQAKNSGPGQTTLTWTFRVGQNQDNPEDECDEWDDDKEWERDD